MKEESLKDFLFEFECFLEGWIMTEQTTRIIVNELGYKEDLKDIIKLFELYLKYKEK